MQIGVNEKFLDKSSRKSQHTDAHAQRVEGCSCLGEFWWMTLDSSHTFEKQGPRAQVDRKIYKRHMQSIIFGYPNLDVRSASVFDLVFDNSIAPSTSTSSSTWGTMTGVRLGARAI